MIPANRHVKFAGRLVIVGFGSIGQGVLPLLLRHIDMTPQQITIVTAEERGAAMAQRIRRPLRADAADPRELSSRCSSRCSAAGDFLLNVSVEVSSVALIELCQENGALYLDTCIEPWPGGYTDPTLPPSAALQLRAARERAGAAHGAGARRRPRC